MCTFTVKRTFDAVLSPAKNRIIFSTFLTRLGSPELIVFHAFSHTLFSGQRGLPVLNLKLLKVCPVWEVNPTSFCIWLQSATHPLSQSVFTILISKLLKVCPIWEGNFGPFCLFIHFLPLSHSCSSFLFPKLLKVVLNISFSGTGSWTWTQHPRIMSQVFYHCATHRHLKNIDCLRVPCLLL